MSDSAKNKDPECIMRMAETKRKFFKEHPEAHPMLGRKHTEESKKKMSETRRNSAKLMEISRQNLNYVGFGEDNQFFGKHHTQETKEILSKQHRKQIEMYSLDGEYIRTFDSVTEASIFLCGSKQYLQSIQQCANGMYKTSHGYVWKYKDKI